MNDNINKSLERSQKCININMKEDQNINDNKNQVECQPNNFHIKTHQNVY